jgi:signal transduction histidine kinase
MPPFVPRPRLLTVLLATVLVAIFVMSVLHFRREFRQEIRQTLIERDGEVLFPVVLNQIADSSAELIDERLASVLRSARQRGVLAIALFDASGRPHRSVPTHHPFVNLAVEDYVRLATESRPISRYDPHFPLARHFPSVGLSEPAAPVLEVLLPLQLEHDDALLGVARLHLDARALARELGTIDARINRHTTATLVVGAALIIVVVAVASTALRWAHRAVAERNERLLRANYELSLAAKASALGQITAHLLHGLQGPVAGLRAAMAPAGPLPEEGPDWPSARAYTERLQAMIEETVRLLADATHHLTYELTGDELAQTLRQQSAALIQKRGVHLQVTQTFTGRIDNHRGGLLCLIGANLVENALLATPAGRFVHLDLNGGSNRVLLRVRDEGAGVPETLRATLFEPGRSGRPGGTGLGLAISRLLALQIGAQLELLSTGPQGSVFQLTVPLPPA